MYHDAIKLMDVEWGPKSFHTFRSPHEKKSPHDACFVFGWLILLTEGFIETLTLSLSSTVFFHFLNLLPLTSCSVPPTPAKTYAAKKGKEYLFSQIVST